MTEKAAAGTMNEGHPVSIAPTPFVSVVIPVYNDRERLELCLAALERQTYRRDRYEVIVVDNGSTQPLEDLLDRFRIRLEREPKVGSYAARNRGIAVAGGDVLAFLDSDCVPRSDWIERAVAAVERNPSCGMIAGGVDLLVRDFNRPNAVELYEQRTRFRQQENLERRRYAPTANLITRRAVIDDIGAFDDRFRSSGDFEWGRRVFAAGYQQVYADDVRVTHPARRTLRELGGYRSRLLGGIRMRVNTDLDPPVRGPGKRALAALVPPVFSVRFMAERASVDSAGQLAKLALVIWFVRFADAFESIRLALGREPRR